MNAVTQAETICITYTRTRTRTLHFLVTNSLIWDIVLETNLGVCFSSNLHKRHLQPIYNQETTLRDRILHIAQHEHCSHHILPLENPKKAKKKKLSINQSNQTQYSPNDTDRCRPESPPFFSFSRFLSFFARFPRFCCVFFFFKFSHYQIPLVAPPSIITINKISHKSKSFAERSWRCPKTFEGVCRKYTKLWYTRGSRGAGAGY